MNKLFTSILNDNIKWKLNNPSEYDNIQYNMNNIYTNIVNNCNIQNEKYKKINTSIQKYKNLLKNKKTELKLLKNNKNKNNSKILSGEKSIDEEVDKNKRIKIYLIICYLIILILIILMFISLLRFKDFF